MSMTFPSSSSLNATVFEVTTEAAKNYCTHDLGDVNAALVLLRPLMSPIDRYFSFVWFVVGFPGNLLSFCVWIRRKMRPSSGSYLAALAINDFAFLLFYIIADISFAWEKAILNVPVFCEIYPVFFLTTQYLSPFFILAFTVERYISVCHPYQRDKYCTTKRAAIVIASLIAFTLLIQSMQAYFWHYDPENGICSVRKYVEESMYWPAYTWITEILAFMIVTTAITIINIRVIIEIKRVNKRAVMYTTSRNSSSTVTANSSHTGTTLHPKNTASTAPQSQSATTVMLLLVSFFYIVTTLPVAIYYASLPSVKLCLELEEVKVNPEWQAVLDYWYVRIIIQELGLSHYACNIIFYLLTGSQFRAELRLLLKKIFCVKAFENYLKKKNIKVFSCCRRRCCCGLKDCTPLKPPNSACNVSNSKASQFKDDTSRHLSASYSVDECSKPSAVVELAPLKQGQTTTGGRTAGQGGCVDD